MDHSSHLSFKRQIVTDPPPHLSHPLSNGTSRPGQYGIAFEKRESIKTCPTSNSMWHTNRIMSTVLSCPVQCSPLASPETNVNEWGEQKVNCSSGRSEGEDEEHVVDVFISGTWSIWCSRWLVFSGWCASPCQCDSDLKCNWPKWPRLMMDIILGKNDRNMLVKCYYGNVGRGEQEQEAVDPSWGDL